MPETRSEWQTRMRSVGFLGHGRTRARVKDEGRTHPDSGLPYKTVRDENGHDVTEHGKPGTAVSSRQDAHIRNVQPIHLDLREHQGE